jgi:hypothetical protein
MTLRVEAGEANTPIGAAARVVLPVSPRSMCRVRSFVTATLLDHGVRDPSTVEAVELLACELSTRLLTRAGGGLFTVQVHVLSSAVRVEVVGPWFNHRGRQVPAPRTDPGLCLLQALAEDWGLWRPHEEHGGERAWFTVARR